MNHVVLDAWTRRASLLTLGTAVLASLAPPITADTRKKRKKRRNNGDVNKLCKKQEGQCLDFFTAGCEDDPECLADGERCCPLTADCDFAGFLFCFRD